MGTDNSILLNYVKLRMSYYLCRALNQWYAFSTPNKWLSELIEQ